MVVPQESSQSVGLPVSAGLFLRYRLELRLDDGEFSFGPVSMGLLFLWASHTLYLQSRTAWNTGYIPTP